MLKQLASIFALTILLTLSLQLNGQASTLQVVDLEDGKQTVQLTNPLDATITNELTSSTLSITSSGKELFNDSIDFSHYQSIFLFEQNDNEYILIEKRVDGTSNELTFELLKYEDNQVSSVFVSDAYQKATLEVENDSITVGYPVYDDSDNLATPSFTKEDIYKITNQNQLNKIESSNRSFLSDTSTEETYKTETEKLAVTLKGENPSYDEISRILTKKALENNIPPEILKAIAWQESGWQQFRTANYQDKWFVGHPVISYDREGIGIMQVTTPNVSIEEKKKLMLDIEYNIQRGIEILLGKWNQVNDPGVYFLPNLNNGDQEILENWYLAILAYNGRSEKNDPSQLTDEGLYVDEDSETGNDTYQKRIYTHIEKYGLFKTTPFPSRLLKDYIYYNNSTYIYFNNRNIVTSGPFHKTSHSFQNGDTAYVNTHETPYYSSANGDQKGTLRVAEKVKVVGSYVTNPSRLNHFVWYPIKKDGDNTTYYVKAPYLTTTNLRTDLFGDDRYKTSVAISKDWWTNTSNVVVIARGDNPIDGLAGSSIAKKYNAPLLLTESGTLPSSVADELKRLKPSKVYLLGGTEAINTNVETSIKKATGATITRLSGQSRFGTAIKIAEEVKDFSDVFLTTSNEMSPDALSIGPVAGLKQAPILLTNEQGLTDETIDFLSKHKDVNVHIVGGTAAVPEGTVSQLKTIGIESISRVAGANRYATSVEIAKKFFTDPDNLVFANGDVFIDALPGGPFAALNEAPILLTEAKNVPSEINSWLPTVNTLPHFYFLGGEVRLSEQLKNDLQEVTYTRD
ncbi:cell wall-binding repeat-containing protein [Bacillus carboniphilus]|uniref:Cell wall-binding repeat-containing protein n=1 Tax=Bacillus carboniphilus TaxID=86663 RepID=A0ABY9JSX3_9BACI|nr:cell wall-binding repeat-containing protein [Bacillus carboniphilus]WLR41593.1 cell wall-binding repeat-containing protein [Bacillus carboniphilus]